MFTATQGIEVVNNLEVYRLRIEGGQAQTVPEPATLGSFAAGLLVLVLAARRKSMT